MARMVVIYRTPKDPAAFDTHYFEVHVPLAAIRRAFASPAGQACAADRRVLAPHDDDVQMYLFDAAEV